MTDHHLAYEQAKVNYWREREARWQAHIAKLGRPPMTSDHEAFSRAEKPHIAAMQAKLKAPAAIAHGRQPRDWHGRFAGGGGKRR